MNTAFSKSKLQVPISEIKSSRISPTTFLPQCILTKVRRRGKQVSDTYVTTVFNFAAGGAISEYEGLILEASSQAVPRTGALNAD